MWKEIQMKNIIQFILDINKKWDSINEIYKLLFIILLITVVVFFSTYFIVSLVLFFLIIIRMCAKFISQGENENDKGKTSKSQNS